MRPSQLAIVLLFGGLVAVVAQQVYKAAPVPQAMEDAASTAAPADTGRCTVPAFAKAMGHEKQWKLHNNC
jgi:hypothetical protein